MNFKDNVKSLLFLTVYVLRTIHFWVFNTVLVVDKLAESVEKHFFQFSGSPTITFCGAEKKALNKAGKNYWIFFNNYWTGKKEERKGLQIQLLCNFLTQI